jgi:hypothetical protein
VAAPVRHTPTTGGACRARGQCGCRSGGCNLRAHHRPRRGCWLKGRQLRGGRACESLQTCVRSADTGALRQAHHHGRQSHRRHPPSCPPAASPPSSATPIPQAPVEPIPPARRAAELTALRASHRPPSASTPACTRVEGRLTGCIRLLAFRTAASAHSHRQRLPPVAAPHPCSLPHTPVPVRRGERWWTGCIRLLAFRTGP